MKFPAALLTGVSIAVGMGLFLAWVGHGLGYSLIIFDHWIVTNALLALITGICAAIFSWRVMPRLPEKTPISVWDWMMVGIFSCVSARAFFWLIYMDGDELKILSPNNLGDMSLHLGFINWMAVTRHWWPASPILVGDPLRYPLGSDLFNSILDVIGVPMIQGLLWCAIGGAALTGYALWRWGRAMALAAVLFNGGFAGLSVLKWGDPKAVTHFLSDEGFIGILKLLGDSDSVGEWKNIFLTLFVTQRSFLFALPAGLLLLAAWREENFGTSRRVIMPLPIQVVLLALMPLFSVHTALYLGVAMGGVAIFCPDGRMRLLKLAICSWPIMAFLGWLVATGAGGPSAVHAIGWSPGWMTDGTVQFWFWNFGLSLPIVGLLCLFLLKKNASVEARAFVWPAALVFASCLLFRFAPWPWDNMKLMLWSWIVIAPYLWSELLERCHLSLRVLVLSLIFGSGAVTLEAGLDGRHGYELIKRSTLAQTAWVLRNVPIEAVIACAPEYNQPVLILGHPVVAGYEGHLWSHGLDYKGRLAILNSVMMGEPGWRAKARSLGVSYIYWSDLEFARWPDSQLPWVHGPLPSLHSLGDE